MTKLAQNLLEADDPAGYTLAKAVTIPEYVFAALQAEGEQPDTPIKGGHRIRIPGIHLYTNIIFGKTTPGTDGFLKRIRQEIGSDEFLQKVIASLRSSGDNGKANLFQDRDYAKEEEPWWWWRAWECYPLIKPGHAVRVTSYGLSGKPTILYHPQDERAIKDAIRGIKNRRSIKHASVIDDYMAMAVRLNQPFTIYSLVEEYAATDHAAPTTVTSKIHKELKVELEGGGFVSKWIPMGRNRAVEIWWKPTS